MIDQCTSYLNQVLKYARLQNEVNAIQYSRKSFTSSMYLSRTSQNGM